jgi:hypothetical protein
MRVIHSGTIEPEKLKFTWKLFDKVQKKSLLKFGGHNREKPFIDVFI